MLEALGFTGVKTVLQSGNAVFGAAARSSAALEAQIEQALEARLGLRADVHVRSAAEWREVVDRNPFAAEAKADPSRLLVTFFKTALGAGGVKGLRAAITGREVLHADGRHLYMVFPDGMGNSKAAPLVDRKLGLRGTGRNWNTVLKLHALLS